MQWAPNENVTTYFYKVSRTQGTKTAAMQGTGNFQHFWQRSYLPITVPLCNPLLHNVLR
jgi:hypothetical protein